MPGPLIRPAKQFPGLAGLPQPIQSLVSMVFPQDPQESLPNPAGLGMAAAGKVVPGAIQGLQKAFQATRQPKAGGTLYEVLERAGLKSGTGDSLTPGEQSLLQQFKTW